MNLLLDLNDLVTVIKKAAVEAVDATKPTSIVFGKVINSSPLKINIEQKMTLSSAQLILTRNVTNYKTKISFDDPGIKNIVKNYSMDGVGGSPYKLAFEEKTQNEITIYNGLKVGDEVALIQTQGGQKYIVLDRVVA